jgi:hypothetical protein
MIEIDIRNKARVSLKKIHKNHINIKRRENNEDKAIHHDESGSDNDARDGVDSTGECR